MGQAAPTTHRKNTVPPTKTAQLMAAIGATNTSRTLGVSTTMLHKAKQLGEISHVVEIAAGSVLEHLPDSAIRPLEHKAAAATRLAAPKAPAREAMFLLAVDPAKAVIVEQFAKALGAELVSA